MSFFKTWNIGKFKSFPTKQIKTSKLNYLLHTKCRNIKNVLQHRFHVKLCISGSKPSAQNNDYRPDPTGGRGGPADRIRTDLNGRVSNGLHNRASTSVQGSNGASSSPAHLAASSGLPQHQNSSVMMAPTRSIRGQIVVALYTYQGSEFGDMSFKKGDMMEIVDDT